MSSAYCWVVAGGSWQLAVRAAVAAAPPGTPAASMQLRLELPPAQVEEHELPLVESVLQDFGRSEAAKVQGGGSSGGGLGDSPQCVAFFCSSEACGLLLDTGDPAILAPVPYNGTHCSLLSASRLPPPGRLSHQIKPLHAAQLTADWLPPLNFVLNSLCTVSLPRDTAAAGSGAVWPWIRAERCAVLRSRSTGGLHSPGALHRLFDGAPCMNPVFWRGWEAQNSSCWHRLTDMPLQASPFADGFGSDTLYTGWLPQPCMRPPPEPTTAPTIQAHLASGHEVTAGSVAACSQL